MAGAPHKGSLKPMLYLQHIFKQQQAALRIWRHLRRCTINDLVSTRFSSYVVHWFIVVSVSHSVMMRGIADAMCACACGLPAHRRVWSVTDITSRRWLLRAVDHRSPGVTALTTISGPCSDQRRHCRTMWHVRMYKERYSRTSMRMLQQTLNC